MGWDPHAKVVFGVQTTLDKLQTTVEVRGCRHPQTASKFCAECGKPMFVARTGTIELDQGDVRIYHADADHRDRVVGVQLADTEDIAAVPSFDPVDLAQRIVGACAAQGLTVSVDKLRLFVMRS